MGFVVCVDEIKEVKDGYYVAEGITQTPLGKGIILQSTIGLCQDLGVFLEKGKPIS